MSEYYAVIRSTDHLAHYGVKGMRWGVRRAIERGNEKALRRHYIKAQKKLAKLNRNADVDIQAAYAKKHNKRAKTAFNVGLVGTGMLVGNELLAGHMAKKVIKQPTSGLNNLVQKSARKKRIVGGGKGIYKVGEGLGTGPVNSDNINSAGVHAAFDPKTNVKSPNGYKAIRRLASLVSAAGLGTAAYQKGRAIASKYKTTKTGHAKAVAKRDAFEREMNAVFRGTRYDPHQRHYKRRR